MRGSPSPTACAGEVDPDAWAAGVAAEGDAVLIADGGCASGWVCCIRTVALGIDGFAEGATWMRVVSFLGEAGLTVTPAVPAIGAPGAGLSGIVVAFKGMVTVFGGSVGGLGAPGADTGLMPIGGAGMLGGGGTLEGGEGIAGGTDTGGTVIGGTVAGAGAAAEESGMRVVSFFGSPIFAVSPDFGGSVILTVSFFGELGASSDMADFVFRFSISSRGKCVNPIRCVRALFLRLAVFLAAFSGSRLRSADESIGNWRSGLHRLTSGRTAARRRPRGRRA